MPEQKERLQTKQENLARRVLGNKNLVLSGSAITYLFSLVGCAGADQQVKPTWESTPITSSSQPTREPTFTIAPKPTLTPTPVPENLKYKDRLPADIVSDEELYEVYHTRVYNTPTVKFHLRRAALTEEPIFKWLTTKESLTGLRIPTQAEVDAGKISVETKAWVEGNQMEKEFDIVLVDGPVAHPKYMTPEQQKVMGRSYQPLSPTEITKSRETMRVKLKQHIDKVQAEAKAGVDSGKISQEEYIRQLHWVETAVQAADKRLSKWTEDDAIKSKRIIGSFISDSLVDKNGQFIGGKKRVLVLAVGEVESEVISFDDQGLFAFGGWEGPQPEDSMISPNVFQMKSEANNDDYQVILGDSGTIGFAVSHEFAHFLKKKEGEADLAALDRIKKAWEAFQKGDDSLYYFVFETPKGNIVTDMPRKFTEPNIKNNRVA